MSGEPSRPASRSWRPAAVVIYPSPYSLRDKEALRTWLEDRRGLWRHHRDRRSDIDRGIGRHPDGGLRHLLRPDGVDRRGGLPQGRERALSRSDGDQALRNLWDDGDGGGDRARSAADAAPGKCGVQGPLRPDPDRQPRPRQSRGDLPARDEWVGPGQGAAGFSGLPRSQAQRRRTRRGGLAHHGRCRLSHP